jgi:hypothetical protein
MQAQAGWYWPGAGVDIRNAAHGVKSQMKDQHHVTFRANSLWQSSRLR